MRKTISQPDNPIYASDEDDSVFSSLKVIFQAFSDSLFYVDRTGIIIDYLADKTFPMPAASSFKGKRIVDILPENIAGSFIQMIAKVAYTGEIKTLEYEIEAEGTKQWYVAKFIRQANSHLAIVIRDITEQKRAEAVAQRQLALMTALNESAQQLSKELDATVLGEYITQSCVERFGVNQAWLGSLRGHQTIQSLANCPADYNFTNIDVSIEPASDVFVQLLLDKKTHIIVYSEIANTGIRPIKALFPLISQDRVIGILGLLSENIDFFTSEMIDFFHAYSLLAASALENARLFADSNRQLVQIQTLRSIDRAILSATDLRTTTEVILEEAAKHIHADAVALLALDPKTGLLNFVNGYGFWFDTFQHTHLSVGEGFAGQALLKKQIIDIRDLSEHPHALSRALNFAKEGFVAYFGTPLIARGEIKGVLEVFQRRVFEPDEEWINLLETLSNQIAIAIDNALLAEGLKNSNAELSVAYNATIEGLSRALELRDHETQGHTLRVTAMALRLARRVGGFSESELLHIHNGALLHDIGKVGIPDSILLKPGKLTNEEQKIMEQHPVFADEILFQIEHLKAALDIPRYHHEKWNGSGYPGKLKGKQIPIAARIFSIVDVFDALTSDRPYRKAWTNEHAIEYIRSQSGIHFDPAIVEVFIAMIGEGYLSESNANVLRPGNTRPSLDRNTPSASLFKLPFGEICPSGLSKPDTRLIHQM